ncbi:MAG: methyltransferase type 11, partial [Pedobacter sp.]
MQLEQKSFSVLSDNLTNWQGRAEWFFNREHTDTYEQWY